MLQTRRRHGSERHSSAFSSDTRSVSVAAAPPTLAGAALAARRAIFDDISPVALSYEKELLAVLDEDEREALRALLAKLEAVA